MNLSKQETRIYNLLQERGSVTAREIILECGTNYPSSKIRDLKRKGLNIKTEPIPNKNYELYRLETL